LAARNILLADGGGDVPVPKVADFGLSRVHVSRADDAPRVYHVYAAVQESDAYVGRTVTVVGAIKWMGVFVVIGHKSHSHWLADVQRPNSW
jgi:hypothetical protein